MKNTSMKRNHKCVTPEDEEEYKTLCKKYYQGFHYAPASSTTKIINHQRINATFLSMLRDNVFQYDIVMAGGSKLSRTFVKRTLVGQPGITYKYLGLRIFAHSFQSYPEIQRLNSSMNRLTSSSKYDRDHQEYNLTLINYMEPIGSKDYTIGLKEEDTYGIPGKVSVSWHADSSLVDNSSIAVYHTLLRNKRNKSSSSSSTDWRIALRPNPTENTTNVAPIVVPLSSAGDVYLLCRDFNHRCQHMVLAGENIAPRISSTHRVAVTEHDTLSYIMSRVKNAIKNTDKGCSKSVRHMQSVLSEVESEWIRQYWVQGSVHATLHEKDWKTPMENLEKYWRILEYQTKDLVLASLKTEKRDVLNVLVSEFRTRHKSRVKWNERLGDKVYKSRIESKECAPIERPVFIPERMLPKDLSGVIETIEAALSKKKRKKI